MGYDGREWSTELLAMLWEGQDIPEDWKKDLICPIYKKGDKTKCSNYRRISLMSHAFKVYERILERRLRGCVESKLSECQNGFRSGRGTILDLENALDRFQRQKQKEKKVGDEC